MRSPRAARCDFVSAVAAELPLRVITEMVGVPQEDRHRVFEWSNRLVGFEIRSSRRRRTGPASRRGAVHVRAPARRPAPRRAAGRPHNDTAAGRSGWRRTERAGLRRVLPAALRRRQRDDPQSDLRRHADVHGAAGTAPAAARRSVAHAARGGRDAPLGLAHHLLPPHRHARHRDARRSASAKARRS